MKTNGPNPSQLVEYAIDLEGILTIIYFGRPIAVIDSAGQIIMRDERYPLGLVDYLVENINGHKFWLN